MRKSKLERERGSGLSRRHFVNTVASGAAEAAILTLPGEAAAQNESGQAASETVKTVLNINGRAHSLTVEPRWTLQYVLRERLGLTGTKSACERGECGSCTVLIDGVAR